MVKESDYHLEDLWYTSSGGPYNKMAPTMVQKSIDFNTKNCWSQVFERDNVLY